MNNDRTSFITFGEECKNECQILMATGPCLTMVHPEMLPACKISLSNMNPWQQPTYSVSEYGKEITETKPIVN